MPGVQRNRQHQDVERRRRAAPRMRQVWLCRHPRRTRQLGAQGAADTGQRQRPQAQGRQSQCAGGTVLPQSQAEKTQRITPLLAMEGLMRFLSLLLLSAALPVAAELHVESLEAKRSEWETYRFPLFKGDSVAIGRINTYLHAVVLNGLPGRFERSPFERIWPKNGEIWGTNSLDYRIDAEQPGFLSLTISGEYTGAYTSMGHVTYLFDLASGQPIGLSQLFTSAGLQRLGERIGRERSKRIEDYLAGIPVPTGYGDQQGSLSRPRRIQRRTARHVSTLPAQSQRCRPPL